MLIALFVFLILQNNIFDSLVDLYFNFKIFIFLKKKPGFAGKPKHIGDYNFLNILIKITIKEKQTHKI